MPIPPILANAGSPNGEIPLWLSAPFALLLLLIAVMPLASLHLRHWWERYYPGVSIGLGLSVAAYYLAVVPGGGAAVGHTLSDYASFLCLTGSLFVVAGGIHLSVRDDAAPLTKVAFLAVGALAANLIGTTGASMVLIRPWLRLNRSRPGPHQVVFFIFLVSNVGGALTPVGAPLFLGYLRGMPFFWLTGRVLGPWLVTVGLLLAAFYVMDSRWGRTEPTTTAEPGETEAAWGLEGKGNLFLLAVVVGALFLPGRFFLREAVMLGAAVFSWYATPRRVHVANAFTFGPIREVALLFAGIFLTLLPALGYVDGHGGGLGVKKPIDYYFAAGGLSAVLDNAPTYVSFLRLAEATAREEHPADFPAGDADEVAVLKVLRQTPADALRLIAISLGAVFFGAMTYIGNGPNFMVKSIAHDAGAPGPTFFGFIFKFSLPILLPILGLVGWLFL